MKIEILGVGTGLCPELGNMSFVVWDNNETSAILFDCGFTVYPSLRKNELYGGRDIISKIGAVVISHGHSDHIGSLDALLSYRAFVLKKKTVVVGGGLDDFFNLCHLDRKQSVDEDRCNRYRFSLFETEHCFNMESCCCLWDTMVFYSGDSGRSLLNHYGAQKAMVVIHEVSLETISYRKDGVATDLNIHVGIDDLYKDSTPEVRAKTWLGHYTPQEKNALAKKAREYGFAGLLEPGQFINF